MKLKLTLCALACFATSAMAAGSISYAELLAQSGGDATPRSLLGKTITVVAKGSGELGFFTSQGKELTFVCKSGEKSLTGAKPKVQTFTGTLQAFQGWDGTTISTLTNCVPGTSVGSPAVEVPAASATTSQKVTIKGDGDQKGSPAKTKLQTLEGTVFTAKDPGGWYFGIQPAGKKPVRISYQGASFTDALIAMEDKMLTVTATGYVGTYQGGFVAFDNAHDVVVEVVAKK